VKVRKKKAIALSQDGVLPKKEPIPKIRTSESEPGATICNHLNDEASDSTEHLDTSTSSQTATMSRDSSSSSLFDSVSTSQSSSHSYIHPSKKSKGDCPKLGLRGPKLRKKRNSERPSVPDPVTLVRRSSILDNTNSNANSNSIVRSPSFPPPRVLVPQDSEMTSTLTPRSEWTYPGQEEVDAWLDANGFSRYKYMFFEHEINMDSVYELTREDLREMGIWKVGVILNILRAASISENSNP